MKDHYYFDNASTSFPKAPGVAEAMAFYLTEVGGNMGRGDYAPAYDAAARALEVRDALCRRFGGPQARNVLFTPGCTYSLNTVLKGLLRPGDRVAASVMAPWPSWSGRGWRWSGSPVTAAASWTSPGRRSC